MNFSPELLLISSVGVVGVLHTIVPDHWVPIALIARQRGWSSGETARAALTAGIGHVVSTLIIASVIWFAGVAVAAKFGHFIDTAASVALIGFGDFVMARVESRRRTRPSSRTRPRAWPQAWPQPLFIFSIWPGAHGDLWAGIAADRHCPRRHRAIDFRTWRPAPLSAVGPGGRSGTGGDAAPIRRAAGVSTRQARRVLGVCGRNSRAAQF